MQERRASHRHRVTFRLVFDDGESFEMADVLDLSATGLAVQTPARPARGHVVRLVPVGDASGMLFDIEAEVVRVEPSAQGHRVGLRFIDVGKPEIAGLRRLWNEMPPTDIVLDVA